MINSIIKNLIIRISCLYILVIAMILLLCENVSAAPTIDNIKNLDLSKISTISDLVKSIDIKYDKDYEVLELYDKSKAFVFYNNIGLKEEKYVTLPSTKMINDCELSIADLYYDINSDGYYPSAVFNYKKKPIEIAKNLKCDFILKNMLDFSYHPYTLCEFNKFSIEELKLIEKELLLVFEEFKEIDKGSVCGFSGDSIISNIKSVKNAIEKYNEERHNKYQSLSMYIIDDYVQNVIFKLGKNLVGMFRGEYGSSYKRTATNICSINNIKESDNDLYYEADLTYRETFYFNKDVMTNLNVGDLVIIWTTPRNKMASTMPLCLICMAKDDLNADGTYHDDIEHTSFSFFDLQDADNIKYLNNKNLIKTTAIDYDIVNGYYVSYHGNEEQSTNTIFGEMECEEELSISSTIPIRILKNARVFGSYWFENIDSYFSDFHDSEFEKNDDEDVYLDNIFNRNVFFQYEYINDKYDRQFFLPEVIDETSIEENDIKKFDYIDYITLLTYDSKGYVTGIYKGEY